MPPRHRYRPRFTVYILTLVLFLIGATTALLVTRGYAIDFDSGTLHKRGLLALQSDPNPAEILVDGEPDSKRTDARLSLRPGTYDVEVRKDGRLPWRKTVRIDPGEAVIESITLFPESPQRTFLTEGAVSRVAISSDGRSAAAVTRHGGQYRLESIDLGAGTSRTIAALPATLAKPRSLAISENGNRVLLSGSNHTNVFEHEGGQTRELPGTDGRFIDDRVLTVRGSRIQIQAADGSAAKTVATAPRAWAEAKDAVYILDVRGVTRIGPNGAERRIPGTETVVSLAATSTEAVLAESRDGSFGLLRDGRQRKLGQGFVQAALEQGGRHLAYRTASELHLLELDSGKDRLVTRLADPPERIYPFADGSYLLYRRGDDLHAIARDGTNDRVVARQAGSEPVVLALDMVITTDRVTGRLIRINLKDS
ncbi:MAG: PEGA domain-containing protein [bacterium]|nr:PEGA domain-containing protein [bacterium]